MADHAPTPWLGGDGNVIVDANARVVARVTTAYRSSARMLEIRERIVACVNACEGLSDEELAQVRPAPTPPELLDAITALFPDDHWQTYYHRLPAGEVHVELRCTGRELIALRDAILKARRTT